MTPQHKGKVSHNAFSLLQIDADVAKQQHHYQIVKTQLCQTVSDLRFDYVGNLVCVPEAPPSLQEGPPISVFGCLGAHFKFA